MQHSFDPPAASTLTRIPGNAPLQWINCDAKMCWNPHFQPIYNWDGTGSIVKQVNKLGNFIVCSPPVSCVYLRKDVLDYRLSQICSVLSLKSKVQGNVLAWVAITIEAPFFGWEFNEKEGRTYIRINRVCACCILLKISAAVLSKRMHKALLKAVVPFQVVCLQLKFSEATYQRLSASWYYWNAQQNHSLNWCFDRADSMQCWKHFYKLVFPVLDSPAMSELVILLNFLWCLLRCTFVYSCLNVSFASASRYQWLLWSGFVSCVAFVNVFRCAFILFFPSPCPFLVVIPSLLWFCF